jgi:hypothetical protein
LAGLLGAPVPAGNITITAPITQTHVDCANCVEDCYASIKQQIEQELGECEQCTVDCHATIEGQIVQHLNDVSTVLVNAYQKIIDAIQLGLTQNYIDMQEWFPTIPSTDELALMDHMARSGMPVTSLPSGFYDVPGSAEFAGVPIVSGPQQAGQLGGQQALGSAPQVALGLPAQVPDVFPPGTKIVTIPGAGGNPPVQINIGPNWKVFQPPPAPCPAVQPAPATPTTTPPDTCPEPTQIPCPLPGFPVLTLPGSPYPIQVTPGGVYIIIPPPPVIQPPPQPIPVFPPPVIIPPPPPPPPEPQPQPTTFSFGGSSPDHWSLGGAVNMTPLLPWCDTGVCDIARVQLDAFTQGIDNCEAYFGWGQVGNELQAPATVANLLNKIAALPVVGNYIANTLYFILKVPITAACYAIGGAASVTNCLLPLSITARAYGFVLGLFSRWLGDSLDDAKQLVTYTRNYTCPILLPNQSEVNAIGLRGNFPDSNGIAPWSPTWNCLTKANGYCPDWQKMVVETEAWWWSPYDAQRLIWIDPTLTQDQQDETFNRSMVWTDTQKKAVKALTHYRPGPQEQSRLWQMGVYDDELIHRWGLGEGFDTIWQSPQRENLLFHGLQIPDSLPYYAGTWTIPQLRMLARLSYRLRYDSHDPDVKKNALSADDVDDLYKLAGVPTPFRDMEITGMRPALPIGTIKSLFDGKQLTADQAANILADHGFTTTDSGLMVQDWILQQQPKGSPSHPKNAQTQTAAVVKLYEKQALGRTEALDWLEQLGMSSTDALSTLTNSDHTIAANQRLRNMNTLRGRYMFGDITDTEASAALEGIGYDPMSMRRILADWQFQLEYKHKEATAAELCKWFKMGLIDQAGYKLRLVRIGYTNSDADKMIVACVTKTPAAALAATQLLTAAESTSSSGTTGKNGSSTSSTTAAGTSGRKPRKPRR